MSETSHHGANGLSGSDAGDCAAEPSSVEEELCRITQDLLSSRQNITPKRLGEPGPSEKQIVQLLQAAAAAPDHGELTPWRFVIVPQEKRVLLADAFASALIDRDAGATADQIAGAREKAYRAPFLMQAIVRLGGPSAIPADERIVSLGCALQNMLLLAHAMGFGAGLTSGQAMRSSRIRELFRLADDEQAICCVNIGTASKRKAPRLRPAPAEFVSTL